MLEVVRTALAQHATCGECGSEHVFALRHQWTLVHPSGTVLSFASAKALRRALTDVENEHGDDLEESPAIRDDLDLVSISEPPPRIAPIPPVPCTDGGITLQPPPPPRRCSSHPAMPIAAAVSASGSEEAGPAVLPKLSPLPPPSEPAFAAAAEALLGLDGPPSSEPAISLRNRIERGSEDDLVEDANDERTSGPDEAPGVGDAPLLDEVPRAEDARSFEAARSGDAQWFDEIPRSGDSPSFDAPPRSEDAFPLVRSVNVGETSSASAPPVTTTRTPSPSSLADTVKRRRWSDDDEQALAIAPPPRRGGWAVAVGLVAAAAGLVVYLHETSANVEAPGSTATAETVTVTESVAATTAVSAMPATPMNEPPAATTSMAAPSKLVVAPEPALPVMGASLLPLGAMPVSVTTTTNATTAIDMAAAARGPTTAALAPAEVVSEDMVPTSELLRRAHASLTNNDRRRAEQRFRLALAKDPGNVEATTGLGDIARSEGDLDTARERYQRALERSPSFVPALLALADLDWERGRRTDAQTRYATIVEKLGDQAPERAKERRGDVASPP